jgi:hypothetical protein
MASFFVAPVVATACGKTRSGASFSLNLNCFVWQWAEQVSGAKSKRVEDARAEVARVNADPKATLAERLAAASIEAAAEGELVTGLKPVKLGRRGRGGGTWRGRGRARGGRK